MAIGLLQGIEDDFLRVDEEAFAGAMGQEARDLVTSCYLRLRADLSHIQAVWV